MENICSKCNQKMIPNVPRLGWKGGAIHESNRMPWCEDSMLRVTSQLSAATRMTVTNQYPDGNRYTPQIFYRDGMSGA